MIRPPPRPPLFPSTTLSRSVGPAAIGVVGELRLRQRPGQAVYDRAGIGGARFLQDRKSTRLNSSHSQISYAVFCLKKKNTPVTNTSLPSATDPDSCMRHAVS